MSEDAKSNKNIQDEIVEKALETGFLSGLSINHYENHTREELIEQGYNETQIECAIRVLAHFDTSLGAKLGRCPRELWELRPCADCRIDVDTSRIHTTWRYGVDLCLECYNKREAKKKCSDCGSLYDDHAIKDDFSGRVKNRYIARNTYSYRCSWCALLMNADKDFIRKRIGDNLIEKKMDVAKLRIIKKGESRFDTEDDFKVLKDFEWNSEAVKGEDFGKKWKHYYVQYDSYVMTIFEKPMTGEEVGEMLMPNPYYLMLHPEDARKLLRVYRIRVFYKFSLAFLELFFEKSSPSMNLINIEKLKEDDLLKVWKGRELFDQFKKGQAGRTPKLKNLSFEALINLVVCLRGLSEDITTQNDEITQYDLLGIINVERTTLFRHIKKYLKTDWETILDKSKLIGFDQAYNALPPYYQQLLNRPPR